MLIYSGVTGRQPHTAVFSEITMREDIERPEYASMLYDFYGSLLSEAGREVTAMYHEDNLSLSEIAEELGLSRQAVHYTLKRAEKALAAYEDKLGLIASYKENRARAEQISDILSGLDMPAEKRERIRRLLEEMTE